jgi:hypothetical protein
LFWIEPLISRSFAIPGRDKPRQPHIRSGRDIRD